MENFKKEIKSIKPWFILVTYFVGLIFLLLYFNTIVETTGKVLSLLKPFFMAIAIAFVLNIPMKSIECFIKNKTKENNLIYKFSRTISILLTLIFLFIILFILGYII
ncbi:MAG TPA: AI-2E family transporter, partial [Erysipelotrichaceae bacterium]|nr:AI-2E family transporter [Erysipelotrichaceae bacterium]